MAENSELDKEWFEKSNYIGLLSVDNEIALCKIIGCAKDLDIKFSIFREPDIDNQITAIALGPGIKSKKLCSGLTLAFKELV